MAMVKEVTCNECGERADVKSGQTLAGGWLTVVKGVAGPGVALEGDVLHFCRARCAARYLDNQDARELRRKRSARR